MAYNAHLAYYYEKQPELEDLLTSLLDPLIEERAEDPEAFLLAAMQQRAAARLAAANQADAPEAAAADAPEAPLPQAPAPEPAPRRSPSKPSPSSAFATKLSRPREASHPSAVHLLAKLPARPLCAGAGGCGGAGSGAGA